MTVTLTPKAEAHLQALAARRGQAPEAVIETALDALLRQEELAPPEPPRMNEAEAEQERLHQIMADMLAKARARVPGSGDPAVRQAYQNAPADAVIVEKYRRQGFNL